MVSVDAKFLVDANVGRLAKWLRVLGYDAEFVGDVEDNEIVRRALKEERIILTRDTRIMKRGIVASGRIKALLIVDDDPRAQFRQVVEAFGLRRQSKPFTLCLECNEPLVAASSEDVRDQVPAYVFSTQKEYSRCPRCGRIYWKGTHWQRMTEELDKLQE